MKKVVIVSILNLITLFGFAQLETAHWRFGNYAALDFITGSPAQSTVSILNAPWCGASAADSAGNLLFYTHGVQIYNKNHAIMQNGVVGSNWNLGSSQAALVFPKSGQKYYVVIANKSGASPAMLPHFINYAVVDMAANNGVGAVISVSQTISPPWLYMVPRLAGTKHCNGRDYWLLAHETNTNITVANTNTLGGSKNFHAYRVTADSIYTTPVISNIGSSIITDGLSASIGILKFSPNGKKVACTFPNKTVEIFDFDNATGSVSNVLKLETVISPTLQSIADSAYAYGLEFSADGNKLYVTYINNHPAICQYDLAAGSPSSIVGSKTIICPDTFYLINSSSGNSGPKALQLALDGKIYVAEPNLKSIGVISNPNALGTLCNYSLSAVVLGTTFVSPTNTATVWPNSNYGLPNFISNYFEQKPSIPPLSGTISCEAASFSMPVLNAFAGYSVTSQAWNFGDPLSGAANTSSVNNPNHVFSANGTYTVKLVLNYNCGADTLKTPITVSGLPELTVTAKPKICVGENVLLNFSGADSYSLNTAAISQNSSSLQPTITTNYTVSGIDNSSGCQSSKVFNVMVLPCTGLSSFSLDEKMLMVYPNPSRGVFTLVLKQNTKINITDLSGRSIYTAQFPNGEHAVDLSKQANGFYLLEAEGELGAQVVKLLKE